MISSTVTTGLPIDLSQYGDVPCHTEWFRSRISRPPAEVNPRSTQVNLPFCQHIMTFSRSSPHPVCSLPSVAARIEEVHYSCQLCRYCCCCCCCCHYGTDRRHPLRSIRTPFRAPTRSTHPSRSTRAVKSSKCPMSAMVRYWTCFCRCSTWCTAIGTNWRACGSGPQILGSVHDA